MHLINAQAILDIEEKRAPSNEVLKDAYGTEINKLEYAILSYCWCASEEQELRLSDIRCLSIDAARKLQRHDGYQKIVKGCIKARDDNIEWLWTAPCCVSWQNNRDLSKAMNSMYRWCAKSTRCYAYLHDVKKPSSSTDNTFTRSKWFSCSWTLQVLLAPSDIKFFDCQWRHIGNKTDLVPILTDITGIPQDILIHGLPPQHNPYRPSVAQIMSWAADRHTSKVEDQAYSLVGLFGIHLAVQYGEKEFAFQRLQEAIIKEYNDHTIFAWFTNARHGSVLADNPNCFKGSSDIIRLDPHIVFSVACPQAIMEVKTHRGFHVTKLGIELWLPLVTYRSGSRDLAQAKLACCRKGNPKLITLDLSLAFSEYDDVFLRDFTDIGPLPGISGFRSLHLVHRQPNLISKPCLPHTQDMAFILQHVSRLDLDLGNAPDVVSSLFDEISHWTANLDDWIEIKNSFLKPTSRKTLRGFLPSSGALVALKGPRNTSSALNKEDIEVTPIFGLPSI